MPKQKFVQILVTEQTRDEIKEIANKKGVKMWKVVEKSIDDLKNRGYDIELL
jgi:regulator of PEP synthase PpsR (kinase-PPPase family)